MFHKYFWSCWLLTVIACSVCCTEEVSKKEETLAKEEETTDMNVSTSEGEKNDFKCLN